MGAHNDIEGFPSNAVRNALSEAGDALDLDEHDTETVVAVAREAAYEGREFVEYWAEEVGR